jgi:hypothetical protein
MIHEFPLRRIKSRAGHARAKWMVFRLNGRKPDRGAEEYLDVLVDLIVDFERRYGDAAGSETLRSGFNTGSPRVAVAPKGHLSARMRTSAPSGRPLRGDMKRALSRDSEGIPAEERVGYRRKRRFICCPRSSRA